MSFSSVFLVCISPRVLAFVFNVCMLSISENLLIHCIFILLQISYLRTCVLILFRKLRFGIFSFTSGNIFLAQIDNAWFQVTCWIQFPFAAVMQSFDDCIGIPFFKQLFYYIKLVPVVSGTLLMKMFKKRTYKFIIIEQFIECIFNLFKRVILSLAVMLCSYPWDK